MWHVQVDVSGDEASLMDEEDFDLLARDCVDDAELRESLISVKSFVSIEEARAFASKGRSLDESYEHIEVWIRGGGAYNPPP